ncbi:MAG TPA: ABC transporter permease [Anaerolineae bacterium]|nr:ABC transporter permease [Anaerolineae bacterium]
MQAQASLAKRLRYGLANYSEIVALISFLVIFTIFATVADNFLTGMALANILTFASITGIMVLGVAILMIAGEFDLSVGSIFAVASYVFALTMNAGVPPVLAMVLALAASSLLGLINGLIVTGTGIPSFITTLGTMLAYRGIVRALGGGDFAQHLGDRSLLFNVLNGAIGPINQLFSPASNLRFSILWFLLMAVIMSLTLRRSPFGNWVYAVGGNPGAALVQGVPVRRVKIICFVLTALLAGIAGIMQFSHRLSVDPLRGSGMELVAVAACVIGGVRLTGGYGTILGACIGVLLLQMLEQGLVLLQVPVQVFQAVAGLILLMAVIVNTYLSGERS